MVIRLKIARMDDDIDYKMGLACNEFRELIHDFHNKTFFRGLLTVKCKPVSCHIYFVVIPKKKF